MSQPDSLKQFTPKTSHLIIGECIVTAASYTGLYSLWYKGYDNSTFHFFDDSQEWAQMDKFGHSYSAYWLSSVNSALYSSIGTPKNKSILLGTGFSWLYMSGIELMDGFSAKWGASTTDLAANTAGCLLFGLQEYFFNSQPVVLKFSYQPSSYAQYRPDALGSNHTERLLKDYNAQTYWLSANIAQCTNMESIPKWLNLAAGYSIDGFTGGHSNLITTDGIPNSERNRQYLLSFDIDFRKIPAKRKSIKALLFMLNCIKVPAPTLEFCSGRIVGHWFYY